MDRCFFEYALFLHIEKTGNAERYGVLSLRTRKLGIRKEKNVCQRKKKIKISATTRAKTDLPRDKQKAMAHEIATNWALDAYATPMSDYMGLVKTGNHPNFYYRIIPEVKGFGLNYESVDICGVLYEYV